LNGAIRYGLTAIKGLGQSIVKAICEARGTEPFRSFFDFAERVEATKRVLESLVSAGAFDSLKDERSLPEWRGGLFNSIDMALSRAQRAKRERIQGQSGLFGGLPEEIDYSKELSPHAKGWNQTELLAAEKGAVGFYITGHPLENYFDILQGYKAIKSTELPNLTTGIRVTSGGIISELQTRTTKKGDKFALLRLEDDLGGTKCVLWPEVYRKHSALLQSDLAVLITGRLELSDDGPATIIADQVQSLDAAAKVGEYVVLRTPVNDDYATLFDSILGLLSSNPGDCDVTLEAFIDPSTVVRVRANPALKVKRSEQLESALKNLGCSVTFEKIQSTAN
jgi:DNA polymerase-3 subunit alpha